MKRHATASALTAVVIDAVYTAVFWLVLGRAERRASRHPVRDYFLIIGQLSAEVALALHLWKQWRAGR